jgi:hypothetical protein
MDSQENPGFFDSNVPPDDNPTDPSAGLDQPAPQDGNHDTWLPENQQHDSETLENPQTQNIIINNDHNLVPDLAQEPTNLDRDPKPDPAETLETTDTQHESQENPSDTATESNPLEQNSGPEPSDIIDPKPEIPVANPQKPFEAPQPGLNSAENQSEPIQTPEPKKKSKKVNFFLSNFPIESPEG